MKDGMKRWFDQQDFDLDQLPDGHEQRFLERLEAACKENENDSVAINVFSDHKVGTRKNHVIKLRSILIWSAAAVIAVLIGSASFYVGQSHVTDLEEVHPEMAAAQSNYVVVIDQQLAALDQLQSPETERIIADAKSKLQKLETDYVKIQEDFQSNAENPVVLDAMIQNFKNRLLLLEEASLQIKNQQEQLNINTHEIL